VIRCNQLSRHVLEVVQTGNSPPRIEGSLVLSN
jgi:hypothetical protein